MSDDRHIAHGMGLDPVEPDWPPLETDEVERLLARFPALGPVKHLAWHSPRPFSAAAHVSTAAGDVIVKRHHGRVRTRAWLEEEQAFVRHLHSRGAPVAAPLRDSHGQHAIELGEWTYEVLPMAPGHDLYRHALSWTPFQSLKHAEAAGAALARLHRASEGFSAPARQTPVLIANLKVFGEAKPLAAVADWASGYPAVERYLTTQAWRADLEEALLPFQRRLQPRLGQLKPLWTHNDWHASNLLWQGDEVASVLDFGLADRTFALFDLATAIERNTVPWLELDGTLSVSADLDAVDALLAGYARIAPLDADAVALLADLLPVVHGDFALSELLYFEDVVGSRANADLAYAYLVDHARWFNAAEGRRLLDHLHRWSSAHA
ncbi:phosphotransferase enzyme family protein [Pseudomonas sp. Marseille-QA0892]